MLLQEVAEDAAGLRGGLHFLAEAAVHPEALRRALRGAGAHPPRSARTAGGRAG